MGKRRKSKKSAFVDKQIQRGKIKNKSAARGNSAKSAKKALAKKKTADFISGFPIVGIGASAGGLEAFSQLIHALPVDTGMAFVLVQHLDPTHESLAPEILSRATEIPVREVQDGTRILPNHIYLIPPNRNMLVNHGVLSLLPRTESRGQHMIIDSFFQSLAQDQKRRAIGIILSGTASDGTQGLKSIKAEGGLTVAQEPKSAKHDGMPKNAIASGVVDLILPPEAIAHELVRISKHPYIASACEKAPEEQGGFDDLDAGNEDNEPSQDDALRKIFALLRSHTGIDFSKYKQTTLKRRILRRMMVRKKDSFDNYAKYLQDHLNEISSLYADILINVTEFFRDPESFKALAEQVFPQLVKNRAATAPIRIWVPACSTGEEVYSLAMLLIEFMGDAGIKMPIQIFATDISEMAIQKARAGVYPESIEQRVSKERLKRFFSKVDGGYKINKSIRELCLYSKHDVTSDPPFAKLDLVSCRNMLIYFTAVLQQRVLPVFHYALKFDSFLWLGKSESPGTSKLFTPIDKAHRIFSKANIPTPLTFRFPISPYVPEAPGKTSKAQERGRDQGSSNAQRAVDRIALHKYAPPSVTVNSDLEILQFRGRTSPYLEQASGPPSNNLLKMTRQELLHDLRIATQTAIKQNSQVRVEGLALQVEGMRQFVNIEVIPANPLAPASERNYVIFFEEASATLAVGRPKGGKLSSKKTKKETGNQQSRLISQMEQDAHVSKHYQKSLIEEFEATREELTAGNEELQSTNEELQSTNEELETAKEEVQSSNEELTTVNEELQTRNSDLTALMSDLNNILTSVEIPLVIVGDDHRIRRFTPGAEKTFKLISSDVGRPLGDIKTSFDLDLDVLVSEVTESLTTLEREIQDRNGRWMRLQIRPFKTVDNRIDGAVISLMDIDTLKRSLAEVNAARAEAEKANRAKDLFLATLSHELRTPLTAIISWSQMIRSGRLDAEKIMRAAATIEDCGKSQAELINDLLDVSRVVAGKLSLELIEVNPAEIVAKAIDLVRPEAQKKSIQIEASLESWSGTVMADPLRLQQVFSNLLTNAIKFSSPDSKVQVLVEKVRDHEGEKAKAVVKVTDSGKGISAEFLPHIFDRFSQEDSSSVRVHGGLGLGLAIVQNLVEMHGGKIIAESPGEKLGATFIVILPLKSEHQSVALKNAAEETLTRSHATANEKNRLKGIRVLVVDDQPSAREAFTESLRSFGAEAESARSARDGLEMVGEFKPHVLVSDIAMPKEDGYSFIRKIRARRPSDGGKVPALALTAYASQEDIKRILSSGFQAHLAKPVDGYRLAEVIARLAGRT